MVNKVGVSFQNLMLGTQQTKRSKILARKNPYGDRDKDKVINLIDCNSYNKNKDVWYNPTTWFAPKPSTPTGRSQSAPVTIGGITFTPSTSSTPSSATT